MMTYYCCIEDAYCEYDATSVVNMEASNCNTAYKINKKVSKNINLKKFQSHSDLDLRCDRARAGAYTTIAM